MTNPGDITWHQWFHHDKVQAAIESGLWKPYDGERMLSHHNHHAVLLQWIGEGLPPRMTGVAA